MHDSTLQYVIFFLDFSIYVNLLVAIKKKKDNYVISLKVAH